MDPRERADEALARAQARSAFVVTPDNAISPMDAASTVQIPRVLIAAAEPEIDPDATVVLTPYAVHGFPGAPPRQYPGAQQHGQFPNVAPPQPRPGPEAEMPANQMPGQQPNQPPRQPFGQRPYPPGPRPDSRRG